jgi:hypothetical protein
VTPEQVINGILLGTAHKIGSDLENGTTAQVQSPITPLPSQKGVPVGKDS